MYQKFQATQLFYEIQLHDSADKVLIFKGKDEFIDFVNTSEVGADI